MFNWIAKKLYCLTENLPCRLITVSEKPYMERYYLGKLCGFTFYLHRFVSADGDREVHDHPWRFAMSFVLCGSYLERRLVNMNHRSADGVDARVRRVRIGIPNVLLATSFHQIVSVRPNTWTLFMHSRPSKKWGFLKKESESVIIYYAYQYKQDVRGWHLTSPLGKDSMRMPEVLI